ncbi:hypothetical protein [Magnetospirillum sp. SS-4]|uniref:hypothetical protein n=1 Tax=Magnetospirillum sp. SS-4 TaxID=2681465 RepID=UPI0013814097|nr:hypothetical protein [Magnetospirillum sp. SS-4]CAA7621268.1 conserved exported hypothetical protein [Magnetospirillum sp. SS-4]
MRAGHWLIMAAGFALAAGGARADSRAVAILDAGLPLPGSAFEEARAMPLAPGQRLICDTDVDKPRLEPARILEPQSGRGSARVRRCSVFAPAAGGEVWTQAAIATLAGPARLWLVFVEQGAGGRFNLVQVRLSAARDQWDRIAAALGGTLGPGAADGSRYLSWVDSRHETLMFVDGKHPSEFKIVVDDVRLRRLLRSPGALPNPAPALPNSD